MIAYARFSHWMHWKYNSKHSILQCLSRNAKEMENNSLLIVLCFLMFSLCSNYYWTICLGKLRWKRDYRRNVKSFFASKFSVVTIWLYINSYACVTPFIQTQWHTFMHSIQTIIQTNITLLIFLTLDRIHSGTHTAITHAHACSHTHKMWNGNILP